MKKYLGLILLVGLISLPTLAHAEIDLRAILEKFVQKLKPAPIVVSNFKITPNLPPQINTLSGPKSLKVGENGQWDFKVTDPENGPMVYTFWWGDSLDGEKTKKPAFLPKQTEQWIVFNHTYKQEGTYTINAEVTDNTGQITKQIVTVTVR